MKVDKWISWLLNKVMKQKVQRVQFQLLLFQIFWSLCLNLEKVEDQSCEVNLDIVQESLQVSVQILEI